MNTISRRWNHVAILTALLVMLFPGIASAGDPPNSSGFFGIQMRDSIAEQATLPLASAAGVHWIRLSLRWGEIESADADPPSYHWAKYDAIIGDATAAGFSLIITVRDNPTWAATTACGPIDKTPVSRYLAFLTALVQRYGGAPYRVKLWELYNEPDNNHPEMSSQGGCWGQHAAQYAALLGQARPAIKAVDPQAQLVLGGLAYDLIEGIDTGGIFNGSFLNQLLASPGGTQFDIMNFHYYRAFHARWDPSGRDVIGKANFIRNQLAGKGLSRPIMVTEIGLPSAGPASDGQDYSDATSSRYVAQAHARALSANLHSMTWFRMADAADDERLYGLLRVDYAPKPAYQAYQTLTREIAGAAYLRTDNVSGLETYVFNAGGRLKYIAWSADAMTHTLSVTAGAVWVVDKLGDRHVIADGAAEDRDGQRNGTVAVAIGVEPRYVYAMLAGDLPMRVFLPAMRRRAP